MIFKDFVYYIAVVKDNHSNYGFVLITLHYKIFENDSFKIFLIVILLGSNN